MIKKFIATIIGLSLGMFLFSVGLLAVAVLVTYPKLPELDAITHYQPKEPLTIYSSDGVVIGTYGDERRAFTPINQFPQVLKDAVIAAEDKRFYQHWGVDLMGIARAAISNIRGGTRQGASTITQQVARNFYLTNEQTFTRKFNEALLAYKIEKNLTKDQILELYFNQIYLGQRAYGFAAAAKTYFNKSVQDLTLAEAAVLAGLPKAPSAFNPIVNPERAHLRQKYILNNMVELGMITPVEYDAALKEKLVYQKHQTAIDPNSLYVAEMARQDLYQRYGEEIYSQGWHVYTTVSTANQKAATTALRKALRNFDAGSAYRGAEKQLDLSNLSEDELQDEIEQFLSTMHTVDNMLPAIITEISKTGITAYIQGGQEIKISTNDMGIAKNAINNKRLKENALKVGSMIRISQTKNGRWTIVQQPLVQGALVSIDADTGAILAMVGGYDFHNKAFNRATQSIRQPGSSFKPFVYSAALAKGMTASTLINDAPLNIAGWQPRNSDGNYAGMITLRSALTRSKNIVSVRIMQAIGVEYTRHYIQRFGFKDKQLPNSLTLALGAGSATPLQMAEGYAIFANGGYKVSAYVIDKIYDSKGNLRAEMHPMVAKQNAPQVIDPRNAYVMTSIMRDVVQRGTATRANVLGRNDLAGKTGTTNDFKDSWFVGYNPKIVTAVYVGYDQPASMGRRGFGGTLALPIWIDYMRFALKGITPSEFKIPKGVVEQSGEFYLQEHQGEGNVLLDNTTSDDSMIQENLPEQPVYTDEPYATPIPPINNPKTNTPSLQQNNQQDAIGELF